MFFSCQSGVGFPKACRTFFLNRIGLFFPRASDEQFGWRELQGFYTLKIPVTNELSVEQEY